MENLRRAVNQITYTQPSKFLHTLSIPQISLIPLLSLASSIYSLALSLRRHLYRLNLLTTHRLPVPVISVGNLTWGGNGKTPMVEFLARFLTGSGISPLILTRGYGGADEAKMLKRHLHGTQAKIGVGADRASTADSFLDKYGYINLHDSCLSKRRLLADEIKVRSNSNQIGAAILDDGMQHLSLWRDLEIVMVNAMMPWGNNRLLPLGPLREPLAALCRADIVVLHHADLVQEKHITTLEQMVRGIKESVAIFFTEMAPLHFFKYEDVSVKIPLKTVENTTVLCLSGIGFAGSFIEKLKKMGPRHIDQLDFSDHHIFQMTDIDTVKARLLKLESKFAAAPIVVVTEKDYDRSPQILAHLEPYQVLVLCCRLQIMSRRGRTEDGFEEMVMDRLYRRIF